MYPEHPDRKDRNHAGPLEARSILDLLHLLKYQPAGLWGTKLKPEVNDEQFIENAFTGLSIQPQKENASGENILIDRDFVQFETSIMANAISWETEKALTEKVAENRKDIINRDIIQKTRNEMNYVNALGVGLCNRSFSRPG